MIREFSVHAKPTNNKAKGLFYTLLLLAALLTLVYIAIELYKGIVGLFILVLLSAAVLIYTKYISAQYYYDITTDTHGYVFVVRIRTGKRETTLCRIGLETITKIEKENATQRRAHKTPAGYKSYFYLPTLAPEYTYRITTVSRYEKAHIFVEISDELSELLLEYADEARAMTNEDEY